MARLLFLLFLFLLFLLPLFASADIPFVKEQPTGVHYYLPDNTSYVQNIINTSGTLPAASYVCTNLTITHSFNMHGSTINITGTGVGMLMNVSGCTLSNGTIVGNSDNTSSNQSAISMVAANTTVSGVTISRFGQYAVTGGLYSNEVVTGCTISDIGYLGISMISNSGAVTGIQITNNVVDRSMQPTSVPQPAVILRCFAPGTNTGGIISGDTIKMPINPVPAAAEICEVSGCLKVSAHNNVVSGGTIGFSIVGASNGTQLYNNKYANQRDYGIECGGSINCKFNNETISSGRIGIIFDGGYLTTADTLSNTTISGCTSFPIQLYTALTNGIVLNNLTVTTITQAILIQNGAAGLTINNSTFAGNNTTYPIWINSAPGQLILNSDVFSGFTPKIITASATSATVVNNINGNLVTPTGSFLSVNAGGNVTLGANITWTQGVAPTLSYSPATMSYAQFILISPISPSTTGSPTSFSVSPNLPSSLLFNTANGQITGTPLLPQSSTGYTVSAKNAYGTGNTTIHISVTASGSNIIRAVGSTAIVIPAH
jgi:hypothetical protein